MLALSILDRELKIVVAELSMTKVATTKANYYPDSFEWPLPSIRIFSIGYKSTAGTDFKSITGYLYSISVSCRTLGTKISEKGNQVLNLADSKLIGTWLLDKNESFTLNYGDNLNLSPRLIKINPPNPVYDSSIHKTHVFISG